MNIFTPGICNLYGLYTYPDALCVGVMFFRGALRVPTSGGKLCLVVRRKNESLTLLISFAYRIHATGIFAYICLIFMH